VGADKALLSHEAREREAEAALRNQARLELGRRGIVGTETEIAKWKDENATKFKCAVPILILCTMIFTSEMQNGHYKLLYHV